MTCAGRFALTVATLCIVSLATVPAAANRRPAAGAVSPAGGTGNPQPFTTTFTDPDGWATLKAVRFTLRSQADPSLDLEVRYRADRNTLSLWDGARWRGSCRPGEHAAIAGPTGRLYCRHTRASGSGKKLTVKWFVGLKDTLEDQDLSLLLQAADRGGASSGWKSAGSWRAPAPQPLPFPLFPADNPWNTDISGYPVHPDSATFIASIGAGRGLHADFGTEWEGSPIGIPYVRVPGDQATVPISFYYPDESDPGPYPIPPTAPIEGGPYADGDRHILVVDVDNQTLYEVYDARRSGAGWAAGSGALFDLASNALRPEGWTSADAAGLPILPGLVRYEEVEAGAITHALRFTVSRTQRGYIHPATHFASSSTDPSLPPMGLRLRLKAGFDTSGFPARVRTILQALKTYGMFVADNGSDWYVSGAPNENWDDAELHAIDAVTGADFEVVDTGPIVK